jgi:hypothetical protein
MLRTVSQIERLSRTQVPSLETEPETAVTRLVYLGNESGLSVCPGRWRPNRRRRSDRDRDIR